MKTLRDLKALLDQMSEQELDRVVVCDGYEFAWYWSGTIVETAAIPARNVPTFVELEWGERLPL